ncbi:MAG: hypothetical protein K2P41_11490, partial [Lachnospiraceae bacterium]|nr:hypothetical protein [Lachnospiraceae bacterium]
NKSGSGNPARMGAVIPLTLIYKLNSVCNAISSSPYRQACLQSCKDTHKNQLQGKYNTISGGCQVHKYYI